MANPLQELRERCDREHAEEVARGEHDAECEYRKVDWRGSTLLLCNCSKRRRIAAGHAEPPGELLWQSPICPRCNEEVDHDGESYVCPRCCCSWDDKGITATFCDDYGDLLRGTDG